MVSKKIVWSEHERLNYTTLCNMTKMPPTPRSKSSGVKSAEMARTMRHIAIQNSRSRAMSNNLSKQHTQIIVGVRNNVKLIVKTLAWHNIVLKMSDDCTVHSLKAKLAWKLGYHVKQICLIHNVTNRV
jgi:hypothetical protein